MAPIFMLSNIMHALQSKRKHKICRLNDTLSITELILVHKEAKSTAWKEPTEYMVPFKRENTSVASSSSFRDTDITEISTTYTLPFAFFCGAEANSVPC